MVVHNKEEVKKLRSEYPVGTRIRLLDDMDDIQGKRAGEEGTVVAVDDIGSIRMRWDSGGCLALIVGIDSFEKIKEGEIKNE